MHSDDATDFVAELDSEKKDEVLDNLDKIDKEDSHEVRELLKYDESTAGGIMGKEYISVNMRMTVADAVKEIQEKAEEVDQFYNLWIVDDDNRLVGILSLKRFT